jgi:hypothetical protein
MRSTKERASEHVGGYKKAYDDLRGDIITEIWMILREQPDETMDISETKDCPAIITNYIDDQESETIHELCIEGNKVMATAGIYEDDTEYDLEEFEAPMLIQIFESVEKHLE